jgi:hypothetical protein
MPSTCVARQRPRVVEGQLSAHAPPAGRTTSRPGPARACSRAARSAAGRSSRMRLPAGRRARRCGSSPARAVPGEQTCSQFRPGKHTRATTYAHRGESVTPAGHRVRQEEAGISVGVYIAWGLRLNAASVHKGGDHVERGGGEQRASKWRVVHSQHPLFFLLHPVLAQPGSTAVYS